ncbi:MAG: hypothetical protein H0U78_00790 [Rickettsiaceae bacterium]|nr:hypothetical protein [Rickettsiaceae bacterium]
MAKKKDTNSDIVYSAIYSVRSNQWEIQDNQYNLLKSLVSLPELYKDFTFDNLGKETVKTITNDLVAITSFNEAIKAQASVFTPSYGIKTNKIAEALNLALPLTTEGNIGRILGGLLPPGYDNSIEKGVLPTLGAKDAYWGTSKPTTVTTLLRAAYYTVTKEKFGSGSSSDESSIFHTFDLPASYNPVTVLECSYLHKPGSVWQLTVPHSGYSFGGDRASTKQYRAEDCTSFLEKIYQLVPSSGSSADLYLTARTLRAEDVTMAPSNWLESAGGSLVKLFDVSKTPAPGDIVAARTFSPEKTQASSLGTGGHAGIFLGVDKDEIITIAYNRDMPAMEGFGLESRPFENSLTKRTLFLKRTDVDFIHESKDDLSFDFRDLNSYVSSIDDQLLISGEGTSLFDEEF